VTDDEILVFLIDEDELDYTKIPMEGVELSGDDALRDAVTNYRELVEPPGQGDVSQMKELSQELYQALIEPVEERLGDSLIVVPHGPLHLLPFSALYDGKDYLIENHRVRFAANASSLRFLDKEKESRDQEALVVGDPRGDLKHAREEAKEIAELHDSEILLGEDATLEKVQKEIEEVEVAHLCCHGHYDPRSPTHSCLLLAEEDEMQLEEVFNLDVGSNLVTLSACETAYGDVSLGDEVTSLARGFQYAGSPNVIGTLWKVDDESTRKFFRKFYDSEGDRAERLREAQIEFIHKEDEYSHPFFWGAFQMYGTG